MDRARLLTAYLRLAIETHVYGLTIKVAALEDVIRSKEAADRPRDRGSSPTRGGR